MNLKRLFLALTVLVNTFVFTPAQAFKLQDKSAYTSPDNGAILYVEDKKDLTDGATGTTKKLEVKELFQTNYGEDMPIGNVGQYGVSILANNGSKLYVDNGGNIGIGDDTPSYKLEVNGTLMAQTLNSNGAYSLTTSTGTNGQSLIYEGNGLTAWATISGGSTPGGSDTQVQFNNGGSALGGDSGLTYNKTTEVFSVNGLSLANGSITTSGTSIDFGAENLTTTGIVTAPAIKASSSAGVLIESNSGDNGVLIGAGGGNGATFYGGVTLADMTNGSLLFAGANGLVKQDNSSFYIDDANNFFGLGTNSSLKSPMSIVSSNATAFTNLAGSSVKSGALNSLTTYTTDPATSTYINYFGTLLNIASGTPSGTTEIISVEGRTDAGTSTNYSTMNGLAVRLLHAGSGTQSAQQGLFLQTGTPDGSSGSSSNPTAGRFSVILAGNGTTSIAQAASASVQSSGVNTITSAYGYRLTGITNTGGGTITNTYGVYIDDITSGTQTNTPFSFYAADAGALNYFAGKTGINQTAPTSMLDVVPASSSTIGSIVKGAASQSASLTEWQNSSATVLAKVASTGNLTIGSASVSGSAKITLDDNSDDQRLVFANAGTARSSIRQVGGHITTLNDSLLRGVDLSGIVNDAGSGNNALLRVAGTWNSGGSTMEGIRLNVTDTASAAASTLLDLRVGGTSKASIDKSGVTTLTNNLDVLDNVTVNGTTATEQLSVNGAYALTVHSGTNGQVLTYNGGLTEWSSITGTGTVTSVDATGVNGITITDGPITASGSLTVTLDAGTNGSLLFANGSGLGQDNSNLFYDDTYDGLYLSRSAPVRPAKLLIYRKSTDVTGTVSTTAASGTVTGTGTIFSTQVFVGDKIVVNGETRTVLSVASDTSLTTDNWTGNNTTQAYSLKFVAPGRVSTTSGSGTVTGTGTSFLSDVAVGDTIEVNGETRTVSAIASNTSLTTDNWTGSNTTLTYLMPIQRVASVTNAAMLGRQISLNKDQVDGGGSALFTGTNIVAQTSTSTNTNIQSSSFAMGVTLGARNTNDWTDTPGLTVQTASLATQSGATGTVTNFEGVRARFAYAATGATITNTKLFTTSLNSNSGSMTNTYAYYVDDITTGTQTNTPFGFYNSDANSLNYFAGKTGINQTAPTSMLDIVPASSSTKGQIIKMAASQSANPFEVQNSSATVKAFINPSGHVVSSNFMYLDGLGSSAYWAYVGGPMLTDKTVSAPAFLSNAFNSSDNSISLLSYDGGTTNRFYDGSGVINLELIGSTGAVFNNSGVSTMDFRMEGDTEANLFFLDASADKIGLRDNTPDSTLEVNGSFATAVSAVKVADYTVTATDSILLGDTSGAASFTFTLPTAVGIAGREYTFKDVGGNAAIENIIINGNAAETIDGSATKAIDSSMGSYVLISDGSNWRIKSQIAAGVGSGTVTSVDATGVNGITITSGPITTSGTLTVTLDQGSINTSALNNDASFINGIDASTITTVEILNGTIIGEDLGAINVTEFTNDASYMNGSSLVVTMDQTLIDNGTAGALLIEGAANTFSENASTLFYDVTNKRLGVGTNAPSSDLHVSSTGTETILTIENTDTGGIPFQLITTGDSSGYSDPAHFLIRDASSAATRLTIDNNGYLGIGVTNPVYKIETDGTLGVGDDAYFAANVGIDDLTPDAKLDVNGTTLTVDLLASGHVNGAAGYFNGMTINGAYALTISPGSNGEVLTYDGNGATIWAAPAGGAMAIGATVTSATNGSILFARPNATLAQDNSNLYWDDVNNRLGIGTTSPLGQLHLGASTNTFTSYSTATTFNDYHDSTNKSMFDMHYTETTGAPANTNSIGEYLYGKISQTSGTFYGKLAKSQVPNTNSSNLTSVYGDYTGVYNHGSGTLTNLIGIEGYAYKQNTGAVTNIYGGKFTADHNAGAAATNMYGLYTDTLLRGNAATSAYGVRSSITHSAGGTTMGTAYGYHTSIAITSSGDITNTYGYYAGDITSGIQTNTPFSFYASDANAIGLYSAGKVGINATAPTSMLDVVPTSSSTIGLIVKGAASQTANLVEARNSSATVVASVDPSGYVTANAYAAGSSLVNAQTGTTYTNVVGDNGRIVTCSNASAITFTVTDSGMPADYSFTVYQLGAGQVSFTAGGTAVLRNVYSHTKIAGQYGAVVIKRVGSTTDFIITGATGT